ncbi:uncharacterized protein SPSK_09495 [Sporothrix schenckii 1099-18]|uniref:Uncharacterized protein n=1 Tax=Sporothrix schenckii 1099-18 TaxID=1397361 RepID=A0A0F2M6U9_SPOSC|nr:uncharacterized protein SPSK_09495 [Sporothrix schenckii 1099-18]KJR84525.1 hypothetical protein SPSK_09495 [Sporothrix schenckii 1099-18]
MADWSEIFEQRLQTVLQDDKEQGAKGVGSGASALSSRDLDLTPPPTHHKVPIDPTGAFFESIQNQSRSSSLVAKATMTNHAVGSGHHAFQYFEPSSASSFSSLRTVVTPAAQILRTASTSPPVIEIDRPDLTGLQESYSSRAEELHSEATNRMAAAQDELEAELGRMAQREEAFLSNVAGKQAHFSRSAESWMVKVQTRENTGRGDVGGGGPVEKDERIVDRIEMVRAAAVALESDLEKLWKEWDQAHNEATDVLQAMTSENEDEERDQILAKAKKELDAAAAEATKEMKENEKTFKKAIFAEECKLAQMMLSRQSKYD